MARSDAELVARTLKGERTAFRELVLRYSASTYALVSATVGRTNEVEDLAQEVFLKAFKGLHSLQKPDRFGSWLYGITRNTCLAWLRKQGEPPVSLEGVLVEHLTAGDPVSQDVPERNERRREIRRAIEDLPEKYRVAVSLRYLAEMSCEEIANLLSISTSGVYARLSRARSMLRRKLRAAVGCGGVAERSSDVVSRVAFGPS